MRAYVFIEHKREKKLNGVEKLNYRHDLHKSNPTVLLTNLAKTFFSKARGKKLQNISDFDQR